MRRFILSIFAITAFVGAAPAFGLLREAAGATSQTICSKAFVSGLDPDDVFRDHLRPEPGMNAIAWAVRTDVDRTARTVRTRIFGVERISAFASGRGCSLQTRGRPRPVNLPARAHAPALAPDIAGAAIVAPTSPQLATALDAAFAEPPTGAPRHTQAIVVVRHGHIIAERYAPGLNPNTPLLSHSLAKSVTSALVGVLARDGAMRLDAPIDLPGWSDAAHRAITLENLLRMNAGFGFDEGAGASIATHIWYVEADGAAASAKAKLKSPPSAAWGYCSRCYMIAAKLLADRVGGSPLAFRDFAQRELFDPLGMTSALFEFDAAGSPMGANAMFATPRDFAKFGLLYLNDGVVGGKRILPEGWVRRSTTPTVSSGYGMGFWLNTTDARIAEWGMQWGLPGAPKDAYFARGYLGQYIVVVPSADLVVVRFGQSHARAGDVASVGELVRAVIAAGE